MKDKKLQRLTRLSEGRCPIHGLPMSQISVWYEDGWCWGGCPRRDCDLAAKFREPCGQGFDLCNRKWEIHAKDRWDFLAVYSEIVKSVLPERRAEYEEQIAHLWAHYTKLDEEHRG